MVDEVDDSGLRVDSSGILLELVGDVDSARNWSSGKDLSLHSGGSGDLSVLADLMDSIVLDCKAGWIGVSVVRWGRPGAVGAFLDI